MRRLVALLFLCTLATCHSPLATAQEGSATLTGVIQDASKAVIPGAKVTVIKTDSNTRFTATTGKDGNYTIASLPVGPYQVQIEKPGFKTILKDDLFLHTQDALQMNFEMAVGSTSETVTVNGETASDSPAVSMTVDREFVGNVPLNGRSFQDLIQLSPGVVSAQNGDYSVNGQRTDSNIFSVDGVSANLSGCCASGGTSGSIAGNQAMQTALGTTQSLASIDSLQEFKIQTSGYTAEYGRSPGGQVQFTTRSGSNNLHGSLFDYFRNTALDANSFSNNFNGDPKTAEHQNDFGGTVGGPLIVPKLYNGKNRTFYFFSYEGLRLLLPSSESEYVPTQAFRSAASPNVQPFLNVAPLPNTSIAGDKCTVAGTIVNVSGSAGPLASPCDEQFYYGYSYPNSLDNISIRVDHNLNSRLHAFLRYSDTPSYQATGAESVKTSASNAHTWTAGLTANLTAVLLNDLRFNYSRLGTEEVQTLKSIGGSAPLQRSLLIPAAYDNPYDFVDSVIQISGSSLKATAELGGANTAQGQYQIVDSLAWTRGRHGLKFGVDWRRLRTSVIDEPYSSSLELASLAAIQQGYATELETEAYKGNTPVLYNLSVYAQDHWNLRPHLSIDYGLRWEFNPPPGSVAGIYPAVLTSSDLATATVAPLGTQPYKAKYDKFAPRFGFAWNAIPARRYGLTVRGGFGIFYDTAQSVIAQAYEGGYPFSVTQTQNNVSLPLSMTVLAPPSLPSPDVVLTPPYPLLYNVTTTDLTLPYTEQWNLSLDEALNSKNTLTLSYVGNNGRKLLLNEYFFKGPDGDQNFPKGIQITNNASQSSYNALQVQDVGRIGNGLDIVGAFTYAHALDNASTDGTGDAPAWGNSNYDLRRVLNLALNYQTPTAGWSHWTEAATHGWLLANRFSAQSGYPVNIFQTDILQPGGIYIDYYPDLVPNVPIYLHGAAAGKVPGSWRINRAAFACTTNGATSGACSGTPTRQGSLGRNYVRLPSFWALNTALQRSFPISERLNLNFRAEAFNILNHPNLNNAYVSSLAASTFGELSSGSVTTIGAFNALYAMGAARSLQLSLRLQF